MPTPLAESLLNQIPASKPWWSIAKYLFLGLFITVLVPYWADNHPAANDVLTKATVVNYEATSTGAVTANLPPLVGYSPVITYQDQSGTSYTKVISGVSDRQPFTIGQQIDIYYKPQLPTMMMLVNDPYHAWVNTFLRVAGLPFFLAAAFILSLMVLRVPKKTVDVIIIAMPFAIPFLVLLVLLAAFGFHLIDLPQTLSYHSNEQTWSSESPVLTAIMMILGLGIVIYFLRWPLFIIRIIQQAVFQEQHQKTIEQLAAEAVHQDDLPPPASNQNA